MLTLVDSNREGKIPLFLCQTCLPVLASGQKQSLMYSADHSDTNLWDKAKGMKAMLQECVSVWDQLCDENGEKKVVGKCKTCKLSAKKKDVMRWIAEAEAAGQEETADSINDWCCMYQVILLQDFITEKPIIQDFLEQGHIPLKTPLWICTNWDALEFWKVQWVHFPFILFKLYNLLKGSQQQSSRQQRSWS